MWGLNWGQMRWGQVAASVPALGFWGTMLLALLLGGWGVGRLRGPRPRLIGMIALAFALLVPISARALPFTFTNGTVADATQVNANFAALAGQQGLAPTASSNLVDLIQGGVCPQAASGFVVNNRVGSDGIGGSFTIQTGQTLVLANLNTSFALGAASANHAIRLFVYRFNPGGGNFIDVTNITLNAQGAGGAEVSFGSGTPFGPGTNLCVIAQDIGPNTNVTPFFTSAHGFLTTQ